MNTRWPATAAALLLTVSLAGCPGKRTTAPTPAPPTTSPTPSQPTVPTHPATIYLVDVTRHCLTPVTAQVPEGTVEDEIRAVVKALGSAAETSDRVRCVPPEATLRSVTVENGTATLDFNQAFAKPSFWAGSETEILRLYGLVNAVTNLEGVKRVQLLVEGKPVESLGGHVETSEPLIRDDSLLKPQ